MERCFNVKLDTTSEYVCDESMWPKPCCNVVVESNELQELSCSLFGREKNDGYVDIYAHIDPEKRWVTDFLIIYSKDDGTQKEITITVTDNANKAGYYQKFSSDGGTEFSDFIAESSEYAVSRRKDFIGGFVDVVDDFLEDRDVRIPSSDKAMALFYGTGLDTVVGYKQRIHGHDYDNLADAFREYLSEVC